MKTCPNCGELVGDNVKSCFKCFYNFGLKMVPDAEERTIRRREEDKKRDESYERKKEQMRANAEAQRVRDQQREALLSNRDSAFRLNDDEILLLNDTYEYDVVSVRDYSSGRANLNSMREILNKYSSAGWRLVSAYTNEAGHDSSSLGIGGFSSGTNATIDNTCLIFERCIHRMPRN